MKINVIYEDNHIIIVEKPENIPSQLDNSQDPDMVNIIKNYLKEKYHKPGNAYVGLVHRLDRPVGGIMVFAKTSKAASRLSEDIRNNKMHKSYLAIVENEFTNSEGTYKNYLKKLPNGDSVITNKKEGKEAILNYKVCQKKDNKCLVKIDLITGRHHQIRLQMKYHKHPLCGDQRYNKQDKTQIALYSYHLSFIHPITKKIMNFTNYPKKYGYWKEFEYNKIESNN